MNIVDAAREALNRGCCMARRAWGNTYRFRVEPTNTPDLCVCHSKAMKNPSRGWQPSAEDLMGNDWYLLGKYDGSEFGDST